MHRKIFPAWDMSLGNNTGVFWVAGEKEIEGSFCEIPPAFRSVASEVTSSSGERMHSSANRDAFCEATLWRVAILLRRLMDFFAVRELLFGIQGDI
jgi:hypothetical protein